ncbi:MAG TPA: hypothetical protein VM840_07020 [Actinomycetota bacterium]|nr:hypothetical protein [Actinomycetota bacterium]
MGGGVNPRPPWHAGVPALVLRFACGGVLHVATWEGGRLTLHDHDVEAERALAGLGAERPRCLLLADAWGWAMDAISDGGASLASGLTVWDLIEVGSPGWGPTAEALLQRSLETFKLSLGPRFVSSVKAERSQAAHLRVLSDLPAVMRRMLALEVIDRHGDTLWAAQRLGGGEETAEAMVRQAVSEAVRTSLDHAGRGLGSRMSIAVRFVGPSDRPRVEVADETVTVCVPLAWLARVGAWELGCVDGVFVADVVSASADASEVLVDGYSWTRDRGRVVAVPLRFAVSRSDGRWAETG